MRYKFIVVKLFRQNFLINIGDFIFATTRFSEKVFSSDKIDTIRKLEDRIIGSIDLRKISVDKCHVISHIIYENPEFDDWFSELEKKFRLA